MRMTLSVLVCFLAGCAQAQDAQDEDADLARLEAMEQEIRSLIGTAPCADDTDCAVVGLGAKPCGGPWGYLVYSRSSVDEPQLLKMVETYTDFNMSMNLRWKYVSDCALAPNAEPACVDDRCVDVSGAYDDGIPPRGPGASGILR